MRRVHAGSRIYGIDTLLVGAYLNFGRGNPGLGRWPQPALREAPGATASRRARTLGMSECDVAATGRWRPCRPAPPGAAPL